MHWAYVYIKHITKFCPPRWYRYLLWPMDYKDNETKDMSSAAQVTDFCEDVVLPV